MKYFAQCIADLEIPEDWVEVSSGNDACPSFYTPEGLHVFIDHPNPSAREDELWVRFSIQYSIDHPNPPIKIRSIPLARNQSFIWEGDNWDEVQSLVQTHKQLTLDH